MLMDRVDSYLGGFMLAYALVVFIIAIYVNRMLLMASAIHEENGR